MFNGLTGFTPQPVGYGSPTLIVSEATTSSSDTAPKDVPLDPMRFGAARIPIERNPDQLRIIITEIPTSSNFHDYTVYIGREISCEVCYYAELITLLRTLTSASKVMIMISSPGGSLHTGAMIASAIKASKAEVTTSTIGMVASAAALIWSYGHIRKAAVGSVLMFHMSSHGDYGNSKMIKMTAENTVKYVKAVAIDPLVEEGLLTAEEAETIVDKRRNLWLDYKTINARLESL
jgi:ATP-dependent protease ClpP protease subunit